MFFQFLHEDFDKGLIVKKIIETAMMFMHIILLAILVSAVALALNDRPIGRILLGIFVLIYLTTFMNSLNIIHNMIVNQRQFFT